MEMESDPWSSWYLSTKCCKNTKCPRYCLYKHPWAIDLSTVSDRSVKGNSYCYSTYSFMINPGNKKRTVLINDYILNETL